jgi:hypothetical protein
MTPRQVTDRWANAAWARQIIGYPTAAERDRMHLICLTAPAAAVEEEWVKISPRVRRGEIVVMTNRNPIPSPHEPPGTTWA